MAAHDAHRCEISGDEIRSVRDHWALTRREFAKQFGVEASTVYDWERYGVTCRSHKFNFTLWGVLKLSQVLLEDDYRGANHE